MICSSSALAASDVNFAFRADFIQDGLAWEHTTAIKENVFAEHIECNHRSWKCQKDHHNTENELVYGFRFPFWRWDDWARDGSWHEGLSGHWCSIAEGWSSDMHVHFLNYDSSWEKDVSFVNELMGFERTKGLLCIRWIIPFSPRCVYISIGGSRDLWRIPLSFFAKSWFNWLSWEFHVCIASRSRFTCDGFFSKVRNRLNID